MYNLFLSELCPPGNYSLTGLVPCLPCPPFTYTLSKGSVFCTMCDENDAANITNCIPEISSMPSSLTMPSFSMLPTSM